MAEDVIVVKQVFVPGHWHLTTVAAVRLKSGSVQVPGQEVDAPVISVTPVVGASEFVVVRTSEVAHGTGGYVVPVQRAQGLTVRFLQVHSTSLMRVKYCLVPQRG